MRLNYETIGIAMLIAGVVAIIIEGAVAALWSLRVSRRARVLSERLASEQGKLQADVERLRQAMAETEALWQPYARLIRWLRHPITIALIQSCARRRQAAR